MEIGISSTTHQIFIDSLWGLETTNSPLLLDHQFWGKGNNHMREGA